ncbi:MAG: amidohydrolase [Firmicutes bacterium]|nr:amidohydrolase [Bacillota bacterium]
MKKLLNEAREIQSTIVEHRRYFHKNPETSMDLPITTEYVIKKLKEMGYEPKEICKSGVVAIAGGKKPGKTFMLRADMDALPIVEENNFEFKSKNNNMHACGHDMHTAMLLGAAQLLKDYEYEIEGQVKLMFQPAEEPLIGAKNMIEAGLLENPTVDAAMMIHVTTGTPLQSGKALVLPSGIVTSNSDWFEINVQGKGGHGAMPHDTIDPINVLAHIHTALQAVNSREIAPMEDMVLTVGEIHSGTSSNIIPDTGYLRGTIRSFGKENREFIKKRLEEISTGIASTFRATANVKFSNGCPSVRNNEELVKQFTTYASELLGEEGVFDGATFADGLFEKISGSEDFGFVSELVPSIMVVLGAGSISDEYKYPPHHPKAIFDENALYFGTSLYANTAIEWLKNNK